MRHRRQRGLDDGYRCHILTCALPLATMSVEIAGNRVERRVFNGY